jgi:hypothetical protein
MQVKNRLQSRTFLSFFLNILDYAVFTMLSIGILRKELEQKLREAKKRKREKYEEKVKTLEELSEKDKNKWKSFNNKVNG